MSDRDIVDASVHSAAGENTAHAWRHASRRRQQPRSWKLFDSIDIEDVKKTPVCTIQFIPRFLRGTLLGTYKTCMEQNMAPGPETAEATREWKASRLIPRLYRLSIKPKIGWIGMAGQSTVTTPSRKMLGSPPEGFRPTLVTT